MAEASVSDPSSDTEDNPILNCSAVLRKERGDEKRNHTYLARKISKHVAFKGSRQVAASFRSLLADQLIKCSTVHQKLLKAPDFVEKPNDADYMKAIEEETNRLYVLIDQFTTTSKVSSTSSIISSRLGAGSVIEQTAADLEIICGDNRISQTIQTAASSNPPPLSDPESDAQSEEKKRLENQLNLEAAARSKLELQLSAEMQRVKLESEKVQFLAKQLEEEKRRYESERVRCNDSQRELNQLMAEQRSELREESKGLIAQLSERLYNLETRAPNLVQNSFKPFSSNLFGASIGSASGLQYNSSSSSHYTGTLPKSNKHQKDKSVSFDAGGGSFLASKSDEDYSLLGTETHRSSNSHQETNRSSNHKNESSDDSIEESSTSKNRKSVFKLPRIDLVPFDGDPKNWPTFSANFRDLVDSDPSLPATQKMAVLRMCTTPDIHKSLGDCLNDPTMYKTAWKELNQTYGHPQLVSKAYFRTLMNLPKVTDVNDYKNLLAFSTNLRGAVSSLRNGGFGAEVELSGWLEVITEKLPSNLQSKWGRKVMKSCPEILSLKDFSDWLHDYVKGEMAVKHVQLLSQPKDEKQPKRDGNQGRRKDSKDSKPVTTIMATIAPTASAVDSKSKTGEAKPAEHCPHCSSDHLLAKCPEFKSLAIEKRAETVRDLNCCFRCLRKGHVSKKCRSSEKCGKEGCSFRHHSLLHGAPRVFPKSPPKSKSEAAEEPTFSGTTSVQEEHCSTLLAVVPVIVQNGEKEIETYAFLDNGSEGSLILASTAKKLGLDGPSQFMTIGTFHGHDPKLNVKKVKFNVYSRDKSAKFQVSSFAVPKLNLSKKKVHWPTEKAEWKHIKDLELPAVDTSLVTILLGRNVRGVHQVIEERTAPPDSNGPDAYLTPFGWCVAGPVPLRLIQFNQISINMLRIDADQQLRDDVAQLWKTESFAVQKPSKSRLSEDDKRMLEILQRSILHNGTRQVIALPWKSDDVNLPDNRSAALRQLQHLERRFAKDPNYAEKYDKCIQEYISNGYAIKIPNNEKENPGRVWYLPHHGVTSINKPNKVRVVFNCSARFKGVSLNDMLLVGPDLLTSQTGVLLRFRQRPVAVVADISGMYHQVEVSKCDQSVLRFLYRRPNSDDPIETLQMTRHVFGAGPSPTVCLFALHKTAEDQRTTYPRVASLVPKHTYVDNLLHSTDTEAEAIKDTREFKAIFKSGGFDLVQWMSSSRSVLATIPPNELSKPFLDLQKEALPVEKTLGIYLDWEKDEFLFKVNVQQASTMRGVLQQVAAIHDPLGLICLLILPARILLQDMWRERLEWDEPLPVQMQEHWNRWIISMKALANLRIPRCLRIKLRPTSFEIHAFSDASELAFGACVYLRTIYDTGDVSVRLILAKSRVAPLRQLSIPRLELQGALLATRLVAVAQEEMDLAAVSPVMWTDSSTVLKWIYSTTCRYHAFVAHRISEILDSTPARCWRHVPGEVNPADDASRGISATSLTHQHRWFRGPPFLLMSSESWPTTFEVEEPNPEDPEVAVARWTGAIQVTVAHPIVDLGRRVHSLWKYKRIVAWLLRFVKNYPNRVNKPSRPPCLTAPEIQCALTFVIRADQVHCFAPEFITIRKSRPVPSTSSIHHLTPVLDEKGVLRVGGRLEFGPLPEDMKHPVILHRSSSLARLVILEAHEKALHGSVERTIHEIRRQYYILRIRSVVRRVIGKCVQCKRLRAEPDIPLMAPLPAVRLQSHRPPFAVTGIDYFGPFQVVILRRTVKRYGVMFTCLTTRAVHIEVAATLDTSSFLMAFWRFADRRGLPAIVFSDNGTNLTSGERELNEGIARWNQRHITDQLARRHVEWRFSPPSAPHFGGTWERLIKSAKAALRIVLNNRSVSDEVLNTAMVGVESLLNGRPLTHVSVDPADPIALTPNHFLLGRANANLPPDVIDLQLSKVTARTWRDSQVIVTHFWNRWLKEYVPDRIERRRWLVSRKNLAVGDLVLIVDNNAPRGHWPLGRIAAVHPGPDGIVRTAAVTTKTGTFERPVAKLCLLETSVPDVLSQNRAGYVTDSHKSHR